MSAARLMVLGVIRRTGPVHAYRIKQELSSWSADEWTNVKTGSIYHALNQMEHEGVLKTAERHELRQYTMTPTGETEYVRLIKSALTSNDLGTLAAGLAFMDSLPRKHVMELLHQNLKKQTELQAYIHSLPTSPNPETPCQNPEVIGLWTNHVDSCVSRLSGLIARIDAGWYKFADD